jgi:spore coat polysaccharide biosynthesis protein SpsF
MRIVTIIQARMGSTRLPQKVTRDLTGEPVLARVVNRVKRTKTIDKVVIATTTNPQDDALVSLCAQYGWPSYRGSEDDVLDRYYRAAWEHQAEVVVRVTSDCPLIEPEVIDLVVQVFLESQPELDYASNTLPPRTFPRGLDTEVISFAALERAWQRDKDPAWREHVTPYIYRTPDQFNVRAVTNSTDYSDMRWTVDTLEDLEFVRRIYTHFGHDQFSWRDVLALLAQHPDWQEINRHVEQKQVK